LVRAQQEIESTEHDFNGIESEQSHRVGERALVAFVKIARTVWHDEPRSAKPIVADRVADRRESTEVSQKTSQLPESIRR
jgi:hypothetical protein